MATGTTQQTSKTVTKSEAVGTLIEFIDAYEQYTGDDVGSFIDQWAGFLVGEDTPCPAVPSRVHDVTAGSCDNCGRKNYA